MIKERISINNNDSNRTLISKTIYISIIKNYLRIKKISTTDGFDRWQNYGWWIWWQMDLTDGRIGKLRTGSRRRSVLSARLLIWHCIFVFYINCVLPKDTISVYVKLKAIRLNKLDVRKLWTRTEFMTSQLNDNRNGSCIRQKKGVTEENANNKQIRNVIWKKKCIVYCLDISRALARAAEHRG